jgi:hypothetical protein
VAGMGRPHHELSILQLLDQPEWKENQTWSRLSQGEFLKLHEWLQYLPAEKYFKECAKTPTSRFVAVALLVWKYVLISACGCLSAFIILKNH